MGTRCDHWQERFEAFARAKNIKDNDLTAAEPTSRLTDLFLTGIGKKSYSQIKVLLAPKLPSSFKYADIKAAIDKHLTPKTIEIAERYKFHLVKQNNDTVAEYVSRLRKAADTCNFGGQLDSMLRDRFVIGLNDDQVVKKLLLEDALTFDKAVNVAMIAEEVKRCQASMHATTMGEINKMSHRENTRNKSN